MFGRDTSYQAWVQHQPKVSERRGQVLWIVQENPGLTSGEMARSFHQAFPTLSIRVAVETPHKRLPELEKMGMVVRGAQRICRDSGYLGDTWWLCRETRA